MPAEATGAIGGQDTEVSFHGINGNSPWSPSDSCELAAPGQILRLQLVHVCKYVDAPDNYEILGICTRKGKIRSNHAKAFSSESCSKPSYSNNVSKILRTHLRLWSSYLTGLVDK